MPDGAYVQSGEPFAVVHETTTISAGDGRSVGAGIVYSPALAPGLSVSVDYLQIELISFM